MRPVAPVTAHRVQGGVAVDGERGGAVGARVARLAHTPQHRLAEVVVAGTLAGGVAPGPVVTLGTQVLAPVTAVPWLADTRAVHGVTRGLVSTVTRVLAPRPVPARGTRQLARVSRPAAGTRAAASLVVARALLTAAGLLAPPAPGVVRAGVHAVVARVARAAAAVPGHGVAGGGGVAEGAVLGAPQPELSPRTRVPARGARGARAAGAGAGLVVTAAAAAPALQAAVSAPAARRADRGAPVSPPAVSAAAHPCDRVAALALLLAAVALLAALQPVPARPALQLAVNTPVTGGTNAVPVNMMTLARAALALLPAVRPVPARGARLVAVDTCPARGTVTLPRGGITLGPVFASTLLFTARTVSARRTRVCTRVPKPARGAVTRARHGVAVGRVLTRAYLVTAGAEGVDGTGPVAVGARVAWLADTLPGPRVAELCVVLVTSADQGTLGSVQLLPGTDPLLTAVPAPPLLAVAAPRDDVAPAAVLALAPLLAVLPVPALGTLQLALPARAALTRAVHRVAAALVLTLTRARAVRPVQARRTRRVAPF